MGFPESEYYFVILRNNGKLEVTVWDLPEGIK